MSVLQEAMFFTSMFSVFLFLIYNLLKKGDADKTV